MHRAKLLADGTYLLVAEGVSRLFAFSVSFAVAHALGLHALAEISLALALIAYATVAGDGGLGTRAVTMLAGGGDQESVVRDTAAIQVVISSVAALVMLPIIANRTSWQMALGVACMPIAVGATTNYVLQAKLQFRQIAISRVCGNVAVGVCGIAIAASGGGAGAVVWAYPVGAVLTACMVNRWSQIRLTDVLSLEAIKRVRSLLGSYSSLALYTLLVHGYSSATLILASLLGGARHLVGAGVAMRLLGLLVVPSVFLGSLLLPRYSRHLPLPITLRRHWLTALLLGFVITAFWISVAPVVGPLLFGDAAERSIAAMRAVSLQVPLSLANTVLTSALLASRRYVTATSCYAFALVIQVAACAGFAGMSDWVYVSSIVVSEAAFSVALFSALFTGLRSRQPIRRSAK